MNTKQDFVDILHQPIAKALCHASMPQRAPLTKRKPKKASHNWASAGLRSKV